MEIHVLDYIFYFICIAIIWFLLERYSDGEYTTELGTLVGIFILFIFSVIYVIFFGFCGYNISEILHIGSWIKFKS